MRLYLLGAAVLYFALSCQANPIIITASPEDQSLDTKASATDVQLKGEIQEATQGVFKSDSEAKQPAESDATTVKAAESETQKDEVTEEKVEEPTTIAAQEADATTLAAKKPKEGK